LTFHGIPLLPSSLYTCLCWPEKLLVGAGKDQGFPTPLHVSCDVQKKIMETSSQRREENQLDVTECFIALMIGSTCFGHFNAHHQELENICVVLPPMVCSAWLLVVGGQVQSSRMSIQEEECRNMFRALLCPSSGARDCVCVVTAYGVQCLVTGCRRSGEE